MPGRRPLLTMLVILGGCAEIPDSSSNVAVEPIRVLAQSFEASTTGTIRGRIKWEGEIPVTESTLVRALAYHPSLHKNPVRYETSHVPKISTRYDVADAIVFLRNVEPRLARPWDHPGVRVEFRDRQMHLYQGEQRTSTGFIRRGDRLETMNHDHDYHALRGRGAAFFTMPLIQSEQGCVQQLKQPGLVELFDAAGYYWSHAFLFVAEHPYYARTDAEGNFVLNQVPAGEYEIVSWIPSWHIAHKEVDPETAIIARFVWNAPQELRQTVRVQPAESADVTFYWSSNMFDAPAAGSGRPNGAR